MNELLIEIEQACLELSPGSLYLPGGVALLLGLFLWLGGMRYSHLVIGLLGAGLGSLAGATANQWIMTEQLYALAGGAIIGAAIAILLRGVIVFVLATVIFALICGTTYFGFQIEPGSWQGPWNQADEARFLIQDQVEEFQRSADDFQQAQTAEEMIGVINDSQVLQPPTEHDIGVQRLNGVMDEVKLQASENKTMIILCALGGAAIGLALAYLLQKVIMALCCSIVGSAGVLGGTATLALAMDRPVLSRIQGHPMQFLAVFLGMTALGWIIQILSKGKPKTKTVVVEKKNNKDQKDE